MSSTTSYRSYPNLVTSGAFQATLNITGTTNITLPTSGTFANQAVLKLRALGGVTLPGE